MARGVRGLEQQAFTCVHVHRSSFLFKHRIFPKPDSTFGSDALGSAPHFVGDFHNQPQLFELAFDRHRLAADAAGEAALRAQRELLDVDEFRRFIDAALDLVFSSPASNSSW